MSEFNVDKTKEKEIKERFLSIIDNAVFSEQEYKIFSNWIDMLSLTIEEIEKRNKQPEIPTVDLDKINLEKDLSEFVSGKFIQCKKSFDVFVKDSTYWLEYIGNNTYVGRSDNVLNQKFYITPKQLYTCFSEEISKNEKQYNKNPDFVTYHINADDGTITVSNNMSSPFKEGDWIISKNIEDDNHQKFKILEINPMLNECAVVLDEFDYSLILNKSFVDNQFKLWTYNDIKPGDILAYKDDVFEVENVSFSLKGIIINKKYSISMYDKRKIFSRDISEIILDPENIMIADEEERKFLLNTIENYDNMNVIS